MAERRPEGPRSRFGVETVELDLPPLVGRFGQRLREAGVPVTADRSAGFARALGLVRPERRRGLYFTARSIFVTDRAYAAAFDSVFRDVFGDPAPGAPAVAPEDAPTVPTPADERPPGGREKRPREALERERGPSVAAAPAPAEDEEGAERELELPTAIASDEERLAAKSFEALEPGELARLFQLMARLVLATPGRRTRRFERSHHGRGVDLRRTLRGSLRHGGDPVRISRRQRRIVPRRLVLLCDISGSMEPYARAYLQFLSSAAGSGRRVEAFAFATRLTRLTRALATRHPEQAIRRAAATAPDWSSGTRIGAALKEFNDRHGRRGLARGAIVVILSDGWERGDPGAVDREMARLARLAHKIVWVNPRLGASGFQLRAGGMRAAVAHCDALVSGHSFAALGDVVDAIASPPGAEPAPAGIAAAASSEEEAEEPWPSATPVPGSSVAMPSGYGPSRGRTTPGWGSG